MQRHALHRPRRLIAAGALLLGLAAAGAQQAGATTEPVPAGDPDASVVLGFVLEPTNLDIIHQAGAALDQVLLDNVYETLVKSSPEGDITPGLATLEISEDRLTYTLALAEGVVFHDGDPLTASDVVWTLEQSKAEGTPAAAGALAGVTTIEAPDDTTVVLTLAEPDNDLAFNLSRRAGVVVNEGATDLENSANGTGPFTFQEWNQGASITLARNDAYWGDAPQVAEVTFQYFTDPNAAVSALLDGDADLITGVDSELVGQFDGNADYVITSGPTNGEFTLGFNNTDEALSNQQVRQAITQAIDKEGLLALYNGYGTIIGGPVPPTDPWYEDLTTLYPYDPDAARALLDEAGFGDGLDLTFVVPNFYPARGPDFVVSQLADVGINVDLQTVEFSTWLEQVFTNHDYDITLVLHVEPRDIDNYANPDYYWQYDNPEVQQLLADAHTAASPEEANDLRRQAAEIIATDAPVDWLMLAHDLVVSRTGITGFPEFDMNARFDASGLVVSD